MPGSSKSQINYFDAIQLISLNNLYNLRDNKATSHEYDINRIARYYSKKFNTSLWEVINKIPLHHIVTAYFDDLFEGMEQEDLEQVRLDLIKTAEERNKDKDAADVEELSLFEDMKMLAEEAQASVQKIAEMVKSGNKPLVSNKADPPLVNPLTEKLIEPVIKMKFLSAEEMEKELNSDSLGLLEDP